VHGASWKQPEPYPEFLKQLVRLAADKGALRMGLLTIGHLPAAAQFWLVWEGRAVIFKLAYDKRLSRYSPGTVLTMHMMRSVLEDDRPCEISFGRGDDAYKKLWLTERREYWGIEAANPRTAAGFPRAARLRVALYRDALLRIGRNRLRLLQR
jgi:CelD/BcsL family acetyltransferase involved in cellulose biosynthesis